MALEIQRFFRFIIPGVVFVAAIFPVLRIIFCVGIKNLQDHGSLLIILGIISAVLGVPIYWIYQVFWHIPCEKKDMQVKEVKWLDNSISETKENIHHYSNLIWHYIDICENGERFSNWLRNNFLIIHSLGSTIVSIILAFLITIVVENYSFFHKTYNFIWLWWLFLAIVVGSYRKDLKNRYLKRLELFIVQNREDIEI